MKVIFKEKHDYIKIYIYFIKYSQNAIVAFSLSQNMLKIEQNSCINLYCLKRYQSTYNSYPLKIFTNARTAFFINNINSSKPTFKHMNNFRIIPTFGFNILLILNNTVYNIYMHILYIFNIINSLKLTDKLKQTEVDIYLFNQSALSVIILKIVYLFFISH